MRYKDLKGKKLFGAGQSLETVLALERQLGAKRPVLIALYEAITESGYRMDPDLDEACSLFPGCILQIGLQLPVLNNQALIGLGQNEALLTQLAKRYSNLPADVILRIGYEFDGDWNGYEPAAYIETYRRVADVFRRENADNVYFFWNSYIPHNKRMLEWYPGDEYVDIMGYNVMQPQFEAEWFVSEAKARKKPVMIGECSYALGCGDITFREYCTPLFQTMRDYNVSGFQYINWHWDLYPAHMNWKGWQNGKISGSPENMAVFDGFLDEAWTYREKPSPLLLFSEIARCLPEEKQSSPWLPGYDSVTACDGFSYVFDNCVQKYGNGFTNGLTAMENASVKLSFSDGNEYICGLCVNNMYVRHEVKNCTRIKLRPGDYITRLYISSSPH